MEGTWLVSIFADEKTEQRPLLLAVSMRVQHLNTNAAGDITKQVCKTRYPYLVSPEVGIQQQLKPLVSHSFVPLCSAYMLLIIASSPFLRWHLLIKCEAQFGLKSTYNL